MRYLTFILLLLSTGLHGQAGDCNLQAFNEFKPGECDLPLDSCFLNYDVEPDFKTDLYNYRIVGPLTYAASQKFGRIGNDSADLEELRCKVFLPINNRTARPVILFSTLSGFATASLTGKVFNFIGSYFAKKGFTVVL